MEIEAGQKVRMLVQAIGDDHLGEERIFPVGAEGVVDRVDDHLVSILVEGEIVNVFEADEIGEMFEVVQ